MARRRKYEGVVAEDPGLDMSSLIDVSFLLLIYFVATSTLKPKEAELGMTLPTTESSASQVEIDQMTIHLRADHVVVVNEEVVDTEPQGKERNLVGLKQRLADYKGAADAINSTAVVILSAEDEAKGQPFVDVLNTLASVGIKNVTLSGFSPAQAP